MPVIHSVSSWLPLTQTWLDGQIRHLPPWVESHVVCATTANSDAFPFPRLHSLNERPVRRALDRQLRRVASRPFGPLRTVARDTRAEILHSHFGHVGWFDCRTARRLGLRHIVSFYGFDLSRLPREDPRWHQRYHELFDEVGAILCEGPHMAGSLEALGCDRQKIVIQRLGVDLERLPPFRPRSWGPGRPLRVLLVGGFREKKGFPDAIDALGRLVEAGVDVTATLVGDAVPDQPLEGQRIIAAIERNRLGERIRLVGFQPHRRLLAEAETHDVFLSPSVLAADGDSEGGAPVAIIEMAAMGLPVVSTLHGDIPTVLGEPNRALLVDERDPEALASSFLRLLDADWSSIALANRQLVERELDCRRQGERLARVYFAQDPAEPGNDFTPPEEPGGSPRSRRRHHDR